MSDESKAIEHPATASQALSTVAVGQANLQQGDDENVDTSAFFSYLGTPQGHEIAKGVLEIVQDVKKAALTHTAGQAKLEKYLQLTIVSAVIIAASILASNGKLDATVGVLFGTLVGYVFGRKGG